MNSFDLFDTLVARRCVEAFVTDHADPQMEREEREIIPIRENVVKVRPGDVVLSDMYLPRQFLKSQLERVTGLKNEVIAGPTIKSSGTVWEDLRRRGTFPRFHTDDAPHCLESARRAGITPIEARQADLSEVERELRPSFPSLAKTVREARLTTYDPKHRGLELAQVQANFPFLFLASVILHRRLASQSLERVLISSRDGYLWHRLQMRVRDLLGGKYEVVYFLTSRLAMQQGSERYIAYVDGLLRRPSLVVDLIGTGRAFLEFRRRLESPDVPFLLLVRYTVCEKVRGCEQVMENESNSHYVEYANLARHRMFLDMGPDGTPVYKRRNFVDWENWEEIRVMHETFDTALAAMRNYDFGQDLSASDDTVLSAAKRLCKRLERASALEYFEPVMREDERVRVLHTHFNDSAGVRSEHVLSGAIGGGMATGIRWMRWSHALRLPGVSGSSSEPHSGPRYALARARIALARARMWALARTYRVRRLLGLYRTSKNSADPADLP
jgi:hypothetical protein